MGPGSAHPTKNLCPWSIVWAFLTGCSRRGVYTVRARMYATNGERMTAFKGSVFVDGEAGGGDGGWGGYMDDIVEST